MKSVWNGRDWAEKDKIYPKKDDGLSFMDAPLGLSSQKNNHKTFLTIEL